MGSTPGSPVRIVLVGGGYGTISAYRAIVSRCKRALKTGAIQLQVISPRECHQYHGWSAEVLQGIIAQEHYLTSLRELMPLAHFTRGAVFAVDEAARTVSVQLSESSTVRSLGYDYLLLAHGSTDDDFAIPGLAEHGLKLKRTNGMSSLRNHLLTMVELAGAVQDAELRSELLSFVFAGGGYMGVELCAAVAELFLDWRKRHPVLVAYPPRFSLVHADPRLLASLPQQYACLGDYATRELAAYGVELIPNRRLSAVRANEVELDDGRRIRARTVVSTIGQRRWAFAGTEHYPRAADGRIMTDRELRVQGQARVWAVGDAAYVEQPKRGGPCAAVASWAIKQGEHAGRNLARAVQGEALLPFRFAGLGEAASLGIGKGMAALGRASLFGWPGWFNRLFFFLYFMSSRRQMLRVVGDWFLFTCFGRRQATAPLAAEQAVPKALLAAARARELLQPRAVAGLAASQPAAADAAGAVESSLSLTFPTQKDEARA
ncbi:MAG: FAD-dependent oxidoreductase [Deltaproteobacteria bacterium]